MSDVELRFIDTVLTNPINTVILERLPDLKLQDCWLVSGCLFQTGREPTYGIKDYDLFYFDPSDLSWEAEDAVIKTCAKVFEDLEQIQFSPNHIRRRRSSFRIRLR